MNRVKYVSKPQQVRKNIQSKPNCLSFYYNLNISGKTIQGEIKKSTRISSTIFMRKVFVSNVFSMHKKLKAIKFLYIAFNLAFKFQIDPDSLNH